MLKMRPYDRAAIRDSIDEEISDDIEDDVFIRDGKSAKHNEEKGLKRPLMAPRRKNKNGPSPVPIMKKHRRCWKCCEPFCYGLAAITILIALIFLAAFILTLFPLPIQKIKLWLKSENSNFSKYGAKLYESEYGSEFVPCTQISVQRVWSKAFPRISSESPVRKADLNNDKTDDIIFGYGVDKNIQYEDVTLPKCISSRLDEEVSCEGGIIALDGITGEILWQRWSVANVFSLYCNIDIDKDGYPDCVAAGRGGLIFAINGRNGNVIWNYREVEVETNSPILIDLHTVNSVRDLDGDEIPDILAAHVEERETSRACHIKLISGKTGKVIRSIPTPFREEVYVPIQIMTKSDGTEYLLIITGGQNTPGGLYLIRLLSLMQYTSEKEFSPIFQNDYSGFMVPAVLTDINGDLNDDIIVSSFNSTIYAFDGQNFSLLWNYSFPASESVSSIVPGHFDHDNVTDFMVKYNTGPGFPVYYYSQTTILSGVNGQPLLDSMMTDSGGPNSLLGGVSISQSFGGDFFLHWQTQCRGKYDAKDAYEFIPESDIVLQARADTCLLRYNTSTVLKLYAIARHVEPPGAVIFSSDDLGIQLNRTDYRQLIQQNSVSPLKHPKMLKKLLLKEFPGIDNQQMISTMRAGNSKQKSLKVIKGNSDNYKKPIIESKIILPEQVADNNRESSSPYGQVKPYLYMPFNNQPGKEFKDYETADQKNPDEYEIVYNDDPNNEQNERLIRIRDPNTYPSNNRGVRSDYIDEEKAITNETVSSSLTTTSPSETATETPDPVVRSRNDKQRPLNLWDLEMEKETEEALNEVRKYDYDTDRHRREKADDDPVAKDISDYILSSISSTGVLLRPLDKDQRSSIDFSFVMNVRESETYPPLFLPQDLNCVEDKMSAYRSYTNEDLLNLEKQFLKQCLKARIHKITPSVPRYESQVIVTRISITCSCGNLQQGEVCSSLQNISDQKWTEFMGNSGDGLYT